MKKRNVVVVDNKFDAIDFEHVDPFQVEAVNKILDILEGKTFGEAMGVLDGVRDVLEHCRDTSTYDSSVRFAETPHTHTGLKRFAEMVREDTANRRRAEYAQSSKNDSE